MRPIDAEALISELEKDEKLFDKEAEEARNNPLAYMEGYSTAMWSRANGIRDAIIEIHDAPTISQSADRPQGEWIDKGWKGDWQFETDGRGTCWRVFECSLCNSESIEKTRFCPHCGAKMKAATAKTTPPIVGKGGEKDGHYDDIL